MSTIINGPKTIERARPPPLLDLLQSILNTLKIRTCFTKKFQLRWRAGYRSPGIHGSGACTPLFERAIPPWLVL
jgi:hypothetical protein